MLCVFGCRKLLLKLSLTHTGQAAVSDSPLVPQEMENLRNK